MTANNQQASTKTCQNCGGNIAYDIKIGKMKCESCGTEYDIVDKGVVHEHDFTERELSRADIKWQEFASVHKCSGCGEELISGATETTVKCPYCGSEFVFDDKQNAGISPEAIILFAIDKNDVNSRMKKWLKKRFFAPNALKYLYQQGKLFPLYTPYWTYDTDAQAHYTGRGGTVYYVTVERDGKQVQERRVNWTFTQGNVGAFFDDVLVNANEKHKALMARVEDFDTSACRPFDLSYISGYNAEKYVMSPREGFDVAKQEIESQLRDMAHADILKHYDEAQVQSLSLSFRNVKFKHILAPFWVSSYYFKEKLYNIVINGQNGRVSGESPVSPIKVALTVAGGAIIAGILFYLFYKYGS